MTRPIGAVGGGASLAWIKAAGIVSLLAPKKTDIFATHREPAPIPDTGASRAVAGKEGVFAAINRFRHETTLPAIRPDEELIGSDLVSMTYPQYPNAAIRDFVSP